MLHPDLYEPIGILENFSINDPIISTLIRKVVDIEWNDEVGVGTASVRYSEDLKSIILQISPDFWKSLTPYQRAFLIAHEMMHVILNHMGRFAEFQAKHTDIPVPTLMVISNYATDLVINESLLETGFNSEQLGDFYNNGVFWHTLLPSVDEMIQNLIALGRLTAISGRLAYTMFQRRGQDYEYYAWWLLKLQKMMPEEEKENETENVQQNLGQGGGSPIETLEDFEDFIKNTDPAAVAEAVAEVLGREILEGNTDLEAELAGGPGPGVGKRLMDVDGGENRTILPDKKKLRSLVKTDFESELRTAVSTAMNYPTDPTFAREERKYHGLPGSYRLPALVTQTITVDFQIYIDVSGSVSEYAQQFIDSSLSVIETVAAQKPEITVGNIDYFIFASTVRNITQEVMSGAPVDLNVGWGTSFTAIYDNFEEIGNQDAFVYIITDGYGDGADLVTTDQWYWLIFDDGIYSKDFNEAMANILPYLPKNARVFPFNTVPKE